MSTVSAQPRRWGRAAVRAATAVPWLLSTTVHVALLLMLALSLAKIQRGTTLDAEVAGIALRATLVTSHGDDSGQPDSFAEIDSDQQPWQTTASRSTHNPGDLLRAQLDEPPPVDLRGALPNVASGSGTGALEQGGVGSAAGQIKGSGRSSRGIRGDTARTSVFGAAAEGYKFVYVFDRSGSMDGHGGAPLAGAKAELLNSLDDLGPSHQFQIIFYNEEPQVFNVTGTPGRLVFGNEQNKALARRFVRSVVADGGTGHEAALMTALRMAPDVIFFLTDADEPRMNAAQLARVARANKGTSINAVEFGFGAQSDRRNFLVQLAEQNGGQHVYIDISTWAGLPYRASRKQGDGN